MIGIIKESFSLTNKYIILATPLILFSLLSSLYLIFSSGGSSLGLLFASFLFFLMFGAFLSGWFYMLLLGVKDSEAEDPNALIKHFFSGVGEYFLPVLGFLMISLLVGVFIFLLSTIVGYKFIGNPHIGVQQLSSALASVESMKNFLGTLSHKQLMMINLWNLLLFITMSIVYFILLFYPTAMMFKTKNPIMAFLYAQKDLFSRHFLKNTFLYIFLLAIYFVLSVFATLGNVNIVLHFIFTLANFYFMVFASVLVFNYYYSKYIKIGSNFDKTV